MPGRVIYDCSIINPCRVHMTANFWQQAVKQAPEQATSSSIQRSTENKETSGDSDVKPHEETTSESESEGSFYECDGSFSKDAMGIDEQDDCIQLDLSKLQIS